jgi:uncharacterized membrane protein YczE
MVLYDRADGGEGRSRFSWLVAPGHERPMATRITMLLVGLVIQGIGIAALIQAHLGVGAWDVLHAGIAKQTGLTFGTVGILITLLVLVFWWPLRERPHVGTVLNVFVAAVVIDATLAATHSVSNMPLRIALFIGGLLLFAAGQGMYLAPGLGVGAREGLMTGLNRQLGWSIKRSRTIIEVTTLAIGVAFGGPVGVGTLAFTLLVGPLVQTFCRLFGYAPPNESKNLGPAANCPRS